MSVITGIRIAARTISRIDRRYRLLDPTNKFIQKYVPPGYRARAFRVKKYLDVGIGAAIIYDLLNTDGDGSVSQQPQTYQKRQARNYMEQSGTRRKYSTKYKSRSGCPTRTYKRCY